MEVRFAWTTNRMWSTRGAKEIASAPARTGGTSKKMYRSSYRDFIPFTRARIPGEPSSSLLSSIRFPPEMIVSFSTPGQTIRSETSHPSRR